MNDEGRKGGRREGKVNEDGFFTVLLVERKGRKDRKEDIM